MLLIGDACHPMLPYLAQGANSSIEDGAVLGALLSPTTNPDFTCVDDLSKVLAMFERLRKKRGEAIARETWAQRKDFHLKDGKEQVDRDKVFGVVMEGGDGGTREGEGKTFPSRWVCPVVQPWLYGYDAFREVEDAVKMG